MKLGTKHSEHTKLKMRVNCARHWLNKKRPGFAQKMSKILTGQKRTAKTKLNISLSKMKDESLLKLKAIHARIRNKYGTPNYCEHCKRTDMKRYEWANKDHEYSLKIEDWMRLCRSCHKKWDIKYNNFKIFGKNYANKKN